MTVRPKIFRGSTTHARLGKTKNTFTYSVDFVLLDLVAQLAPGLFSRNRKNVLSVSDKDHGGKIAKGQGLAWARTVFSQRGLPLEGVQILLLTQPMIFGAGFNPVSFWFAIRAQRLVAVIVEVNNTFGDRHCYFCANTDFSEIKKCDALTAKKVMHVSPFQDIKGDYNFRFCYDENRLVIRIRYDNAGEGVITTLAGSFQPLTNFSILALLARRPFGPIRTKALIHWQALVLFAKRVQYRSRPNPPKTEVSS